MIGRLVIVAFFSITFGVALAGDGGGQGEKIVQGPCPKSWHLKGGKTNGAAFTCIPDRPGQSLNCPSGTEYFEEDCAIGCEKPPEIPE